MLPLGLLVAGYCSCRNLGDVCWDAFIKQQCQSCKSFIDLGLFFGFIFATREIIALYRYKKRQILQDDSSVFHTRWCFSVMVILSILYMTCFLEFKYLFFLSYIFLGQYIIFPLLKTVSEETKEKVFFGLLIILTIIVCL